MHANIMTKKFPYEAQETVFLTAQNLNLQGFRQSTFIGVN